MAWFKSKTERLADNLREEELYAQVAEEIAQRDVSLGLWAKALLEARGDESRAKSSYIKLRVEQLKLGLGAAVEMLANVESPKLSAPPKRKKLVVSAGYKACCPYCGDTNLTELSTGSSFKSYSCEECKRTVTPRIISK